MDDDTGWGLAVQIEILLSDLSLCTSFRYLSSQSWPLRIIFPVHLLDLPFGL